MKTKGVAIITRTLREGKTFDDYRKAWYHTRGFGTPTKMLTVVNLHNPREIISIGIMELDDLAKLRPVLQIDIAERLANPLDEVVEDKIERTFGVIASEDDFSAAGELSPQPMTIDGEKVTYPEIEKVIGAADRMFSAAAAERDRLHREKFGK